MTVVRDVSCFYWKGKKSEKKVQLQQKVISRLSCWAVVRWPWNRRQKQNKHLLRCSDCKWVTLRTFRRHLETWDSLTVAIGSQEEEWDQDLHLPLSPSKRPWWRITATARGGKGTWRGAWQGGEELLWATTLGVSYLVTWCPKRLTKSNLV